MQLCRELGMDDGAINRAFSVVSSDVFEKALLEYVRNQVQYFEAFSGSRSVGLLRT